MKKFLITVLIILSLLTISACKENTPVSTISLSQEEIEIIEAIGEDLEIISEEDYPETVTEMIHHTNLYEGRVVQIEGVYSENINDATPYVYRILSHNKMETTCGLPLLYVEKDIPENAWVRVYAIVNKGKIDDKDATVLEVIAVETLAEGGQKTLEWNGSSHNH